MVFADGGVPPFRFVGMELIVEAVDMLAKEGVGARLEVGRNVCKMGLSMVAGCGFEVVNERIIFAFLVEGDRTLVVSLGFGILGSGFNRCFGGVMGLNQSVYSRWKIADGGAGEAVRGRLES